MGASVTTGALASSHTTLVSRRAYRAVIGIICRAADQEHHSTN